MLVTVGVDQKRVAVAARERLAGSDLAEAIQAYGRISGIDEVFVLSTCYRVEVYASTSCQAAALGGIGEALRSRSGDAALAVQELVGEAAFRHLVRVASSLESGIVGEPQVLGQVKEAFGRASKVGAAGKELRAVMARALQAAKRIRSETAIGRAGVSWGHAAADVAEKVLGPLAGRRALVVGAGEMARLAAQHLRDQGAELSVVNRSLENAISLAKEVGGTARPMDSLGAELAQADVAVVAAPVTHPALSPSGGAELMKQRRHRRLLFIDLAVPRAVPAALGDVDGFYLCDVDDLARIQRQAQADRASAVAAADRIVEEEVLRYARAQAERRAAPLIAAVRHRASAIAREEVERTARRLGADPELEKRLDALAGAIVSKLLHHPSVRLRQAGTDGDSGDVLMSAAARIFDVGAETPSAQAT